MPDGLELPALLLLATRAVTEDVHRRLAAAGYPDVTPSHGYVFQLLASTGGATGVEVAEHLGVTKQSAAQTLDLLEERGYVARASHPGDARAKVARLTERGRACIDAGVAIWADVEAEARAASGDEAVLAARSVLERLAADRGALTGPLRLRPPR